MTTETPSTVDRMVLDRDPHGTKQSGRRRDSLTAAGLRPPLVALEVGAFDNPTIRASDGFAVRYADYFSADELRETHRNNPRRRLEHAVDVDYVIKGPKLSPFVTESIDLIVANHVVEHLPDPIGWLCDVAGFCSGHAAIFLAVPDMRFTFDIHKQPSDVTSLVRAHEETKTRPDVYDLTRMRYLHTKVDAQALWDGSPAPERNAHGAQDYRQILERGRVEAAHGYVDAHCHFYTSASFREIFSELSRSVYIPWDAELLQDVEHGGNEFHVLLRRSG